jgi:hypothetical protein
MFESMLERARSVEREVDPERMVANGALMLVAGMLNLWAPGRRRNRSLG